MGAGRVFVVTGPSGVGKGTLIRTLLERVPELELSVSAIWRAPCTSISSTTGTPAAVRRSSSERSVP